MRTSRNPFGLFVAVCIMMVAANCHGGDVAPSPTVLFDKTVVVSGGGGATEVFFDAKKGQRIKISLRASSPSMEPYGNIEKPGGGGGEYQPPLESAREARNEAQIVVARGGRYGLTVFDGSNEGGSVHVTITAR